jgi:hypothetical protein
MQALLYNDQEVRWLDFNLTSNTQIYSAVMQGKMYPEGVLAYIFAFFFRYF